MFEYLNFTEADVIGTQELYHNQLQDILKACPQYHSAGVGRDDGKTKGEYAAILYNKELFSLKDSGTFGLSDQPEQIGKKGWGAACPRICTWVKLQCIADNKELLVFNTHFDHVSMLARQESSKLIVKKMREIADGESAVLMGDFNATPMSETYKTITEVLQLNDARIIARKQYGPTWSFNGFAYGNGERNGNIIDHIFTSKEIVINSHCIDTERRVDQFISDHYPVIAQIQF